MHINCIANTQTCVTLLKNTVLAFQLVNLKPMNLLIKFRLLCHLSVEQIPVRKMITTVNLVIVNNHWYQQTLAAISLRKPSQVDGNDVTGKLENILHNSHNSKFTDNTFDTQHESHNLLKLETSNMDTSIPIKKSTMKNPSEERSYMGAFPCDRMKNVCFHCRKHGHFAYECPDLCPPSRAEKDSNWRHSMKQRNVHESKIGNRHFNQSPAQNSIDKHNVPSVQNKLFLIFPLFLNHRFVLFRKTSQLNIMSQVWVIIIQFVIMLICLTHNQMSIWMKILIVIFVIIM